MSLLWLKRGGITPGSQTIRALERFGASDAWDFVDNSYMRAGVVTTNAGLTVTRASEGYAQRGDGIWVNFASGALRRTDKGVLVEGSRTNRALHSRDLTQAAWTATNVTVARNQVGIDGTANSACSLTATAGNGTVLQAVTDTSKARYFSVWIKRITGTGTVEVTLDNGSTWTAVTVTSAYTRVGATQTLADPTFGVRLVTDTDAVAVDFAQLEDGAFPSSPIATAGSSATRAADVVTAAQATAYPATLYGEFSQDVLTGGGAVRIFQIDDGSINNRSTLYLNTNVVTYRVTSSGSNVATVFVSGAISPGVVYKIAGRTALDDVRVYRNGTQGTLDTSAALPASATTARFGVGVTTAEELFGYLRRAAVITVALTDAQLQAITT